MFWSKSSPKSLNIWASSHSVIPFFGHKNESLLNGNSDVFDPLTSVRIQIKSVLMKDEC